jgi:parallel beta-helix repeat protein
VQKINNIQSFSPHGPIFIDDNSDFESLGFSGNGSEGNPYIIEGINITAPLINLIHIENTTVFFEINFCYLNMYEIFISSADDGNGIYLRNVTNGRIFHNTIHSVGYCINLDYQSNNNTISTNTVNSSEEGIALWSSRNNIIKDNISLFGGIASFYCQLNVILNNTITDDLVSGIYLSNSHNYFIENNTISYCKYGFRIYQSNHNIISRNTIYNNKKYGIEFLKPDFVSENNTIIQNLIANNREYGIYIDGNVSYNSINENNFIRNNPTENSQAYEEGLDNHNNKFSYNYWDDHTSPDNDGNGLVDSSYDINRAYGVNYDEFPKVLPNPSNLFIISPYGGVSYGDIVIIEWLTPTRTLGSDVTYSLFYSKDSGSSWNSLASGLTSTSYEWDILTMTPGVNYLIRVIAQDSEGKSVECIIDRPFTIEFIEVTIPSILYPNGGEHLENNISIQWMASRDRFGHEVTYIVFYSKNSGRNWILLESGLMETNCIWDTTTVSRGSSYLIKVRATCTDGVTTEDTSDQTFSIYRPYRNTGFPIYELLPYGLILFVVIIYVIQFYMRSQPKEKEVPGRTVQAQTISKTTQPTEEKIISSSITIPDKEISPVKWSEDRKAFFSSLQYRVQDLIFDQGETGPIVQLIPYFGSIKEICVEFNQNQIIMQSNLKHQIGQQVSFEIKIDRSMKDSVYSYPWQDIAISGDEKISESLKQKTEIADRLHSLGTAYVKVDSVIEKEIQIQITCKESKAAVEHAFALTTEIQSFLDEIQTEL